MHFTTPLFLSVMAMALSLATAEAAPTSPIHPPVPPDISATANVAPSDSSGYYDNDHAWHFWRTQRNTEQPQNEPALVYNDNAGRYSYDYRR